LCPEPGNTSMQPQTAYRYVSSHLAQLRFHPSRTGKSSTGLRLGLRRGVFTCVG